MTHELKKLLESVDNTLKAHNFGVYPAELYDPIQYILSLGGKRLRPMLCLLGYQLYRPTWQNALKPALAVEVFHNFTLMHDDIMDEAPLRRGKETVHKKWNMPVAILSGDVMLVRAYDLLLDIPEHLLRKTLQHFNTCAAEVCEGQQIDMNFENRALVSEEEYLHMIRLKTAVLLGFSLRLGALLAEASEEDQEKLYELGVNVGIGFQLMDDLLDVYADQGKFGKQVGGDIIANKKTFLLIKALESANPSQKKNLEEWLRASQFDAAEKVQAVTDIYNSLNIKQLTENKIQTFFDKGFTALESLRMPEENKAMLREFFQELIKREK